MSCPATKRNKVYIQLEAAEVYADTGECRVTISISLTTTKQRTERLYDEPITAQDVIGLLIDCDEAL